MELKFEANQDFQLQAIEAVTALFTGQPRIETDLRFTLCPSTMLRADPSTMLRADPSTMLRADPSTMLRADPSTLLRADPSTLLRADPSTLLRADPSTLLRADPSTLLRAGPSTMLRTGSAGGDVDRGVDLAYNGVLVLPAQSVTEESTVESLEEC
jgi:hypothetical protein